VNALIRNLSWPCVYEVWEVEVAAWIFEKPVPVSPVSRPGVIPGPEAWRASTVFKTPRLAVEFES
jgi:hypothetical protein